MAESVPLDLRCHPATPTALVRGIRVSVQRTATELRLAYRLEGDITRIVIPPPGAPRIGHELWRHTCFEVFVKIEGESGYHEFNLAPSREWTVYALSSYRIGGPLTDESMNPRIVVRATNDRLELDAALPLERLSAARPRSALAVGLTAVVETGEGIAYWALHHPSPKPDFHHYESFALLLPPPVIER